MPSHGGSAAGVTTWAKDPTALQLLGRIGSPFASPAYRAAFVSAFPGYRDFSYGARLPTGTRAALGLLANSHAAVSIPFAYAGVVSDAPVGPHQLRGFLKAAHLASGSARLVSHSVAVGSSPGALAHGRVVGSTTVVHLDHLSSVESRVAFKARRAIRTAREAGAGSHSTHDPHAFLGLYRQSANTHAVRYPDHMIEQLAAAREARFYEVVLDGSVVASACALTAGGHWVAWLLTQDDRGRAVSANYMAVAALLEDARRRGVAAVDLGSSEGLPGVGRFKARFAGVEAPVVEHRRSSARARAVDASLIVRARERLARTRGRGLGRRRPGMAPQRCIPAALHETCASHSVCELWENGTHDGPVCPVPE